MNQFNNLHGDEPTDPPRECNSQPPAAYFKPRTSTTKTSPVVSVIMGRLNHHVINNGSVEVHHSYIPDASNSESVPKTDTTLIKSIDDDERDHLLEFLHSEHYDHHLGFDLHMIQYLLIVANP